MSPWLESGGLRRSIERFLAEDLGAGDLTSQAIIAGDQTGRAVFVAKEPMLVAGVEEVAPLVFSLCSREISCRPTKDGARAEAGDELLAVEGPTAALLAAERLALNLAQRLSGIATLTSRFVERLHGLPVRVVDTRKTTPGLRLLEKYAVRVGGGHNHRFNLSDGVLIKDNHLAACGSIRRAVDKVRAVAPHTVKVEVEATSLEQVQECLAAGVEIIMLDNMSCEQMREAVKLVAGRALVEASGNVTLENVREVAETGVDLISVGALTHSAPARDISMVLLA